MITIDHILHPDIEVDTTQIYDMIDKYHYWREIAPDSTKRDKAKSRKRKKHMDKLNAERYAQQVEEAFMR